MPSGFRDAFQRHQIEPAEFFCRHPFAFRQNRTGIIRLILNKLATKLAFTAPNATGRGVHLLRLYLLEYAMSQEVSHKSPQQRHDGYHPREGIPSSAMHMQGISSWFFRILFFLPILRSYPCGVAPSLNLPQPIQPLGSPFWRLNNLYSRYLEENTKQFVDLGVHLGCSALDF